jgi:hypothetical protein
MLTEVEPHRFLLVIHAQRDDGVGQAIQQVRPAEV